MSEKELNTELKIKEAARKIFQEKGFAAAKTRDIAEAAGINLALLNYYFRSKKKLFDLIMTETLQSFFSGLFPVLNNEETTLKDKVIVFVSHYMDLLSENPNVAPFVLNTIRENVDEHVKKIGIDQVFDSVFIKQFQEETMKENIQINPIHFLLNLVGLIVFPFIAQPIVTTALGFPKEAYYNMIQERKRLIPSWIESMLSVK